MSGRAVVVAWTRRVGAVLLLCAGIGLGIVSPSDAATVTPAPYPTSGGAASTWSCTDVLSTPEPPATPYASGQDCAVTAWGADPEASTEAPGELPQTVSLASGQYAPVVFGLGVLVMVVVAGFVIAQSRPPQFGTRVVGRSRR